jgi:FAD/FMN-containing dehydrogenase
VVKYEVVLADGSVVEASNETNSDLFKVLKGGGNNFGIVTRFDMMTFEAKDIWDGTVVYGKASTPQLVEAFVDFENNLTEHPDAHILAMWTYLPKTEDHFIIGVLSSLEGEEDAKSLGKFLTIPGEKNMKTHSVATKLGSFIVPSGKQ